MKFLIVVVVIIVLVAAMYNKLVRLRLLVKEGFSGIDVQLKRRHDLVPNIVQTVKGYSSHEKELFERVTELRSKLSGQNFHDQMQQSESELSASLRNIFVLAEAYPELKADKNFLSLQEDLTQIEDQLQLARRYYNGTVRNYNTAVESFPNNILAGIFGFKKEAFFKVQLSSERDAPDVKFS